MGISTNLQKESGREVAPPPNALCHYHQMQDKLAVEPAGMNREEHYFGRTDFQHKGN